MKELYHRVTFKTSALVTRSYSTSFSIAVRMLPREQRRAIYSIYGFVRFADEIVDTFLDNDQEVLLNNFERDLAEAFTHRISTNPVLHSFVHTVHNYNIPEKHIKAFMKSMHTDLYKQKYESNTETMEYIHGSAEVVGLMCLKVFLNGSEDHYRELEEPAQRLGAAFQKVNFLRDLKTDREYLHRSYFPELTHADLSEEIKAKLIQNIEHDFIEARKGIRQLPGRSRLAVMVAYMYYRQLLRKLKFTPADRIMNERIRVSNSQKLILLFRAMLSYKLGPST